MIIDLNTGGDGEWFQFFGSHIDEKTGKIVYHEPEQDAKVRLRRPDPIFEKQLSERKKIFEFVLNPNSRSMERVGYFPDQTYEQKKRENEDAWDFMITGLDGFKDKGSGEEIECNRDNKIALMKIPVFDRFIARCLILMGDSGAESEKNSETP